MSLSGSEDSRCRSWATTRLATVSSIGDPMNTIRSLSRRLKMSNSRSPRAVRSMTMGTRGMETTLEHVLRDQHGRALEAAVAQVGKRLFGLGQGVRRDRRADRDLPGQRQELVSVLAGQVGHRADRALVPEVLVGKRRDVGHVDAGAHDRATGGQGLERRWDKLAGRGEDDRAVHGLGRWLVAAARPAGAQLPCEGLRALIAGAGERVDLPA